MENKENNKKVIIPAILAVLTLVIVAVGATYAYFTVTSDSSQFQTKTITASTPTMGGVAITSGENMVLNLSRVQMAQKQTDTEYYAVTSGDATTTPTTLPIATATVSGDGTFNCSYTLTITKSGTNDLYDAFQNAAYTEKSAGQIVLTVNGTPYDFNTANLFDAQDKITISGNFNGINADTALASRQATASLKFVNLNGVNQDYLQGKDITLTIAASAFSCTPIA